MLQVLSLNASHPAYPKTLPPDWADSPAPNLSAIGNLSILQQPTLALFCSVKCPGDLILKTYDLARNLRNAGTTTISGFHSPMEKECLSLLLRGTQPMTYCPARSLEKMRLLKAYKTAVERDRVLILSPFQSTQHRMTAALAQRRNRFVAALANAVFIAYAAPDSKTEALARQALTWNKPLLTFASSDNHNLIELGAQTIEPFFGKSRGAQMLKAAGSPAQFAQ